MIEIKFKFWNNIEKEWCTNDFNINFDNNNSNIFEYENMVYSNDLETKVFTACQYTGLKDKNGVLIFEGDILSVDNGSINGRIMNDIYPVESTPLGCFDLPLFCWDKQGTYMGSYSHNCEVIGNIFEDKELLDERD